ncbi:MAG: hypothetical protein KDD10_05190 [Phaeodactylibacter sp.]|nr:hypothetical protein [Phaeodactylibacter sp.]MCB9293792.1 hypothetical protein [Lewinellaceae bacterium]
MPKKKIILLLLALLEHTILLCQQWQFQKETEGIKVYYRESPDSKIKELKATLIVESSLSAAVKVISDAARFPDWVYKCKAGSVIEGDSEQSFCYYNLSDFPWPLSDREFIFRCTTFQNPETLEVFSLATAAPDLLPETSKHVRVQTAESNFRLRPLEGRQVEVEYFLKADPGGLIPAWMVNWALSIGPVQSLRKFRELVEAPDYNGTNAALPFIREP